MNIGINISKQTYKYVMDQGRSVMYVQLSKRIQRILFAFHTETTKEVIVYRAVLASRWLS